MARAYTDDLRSKFLAAYDYCGDTLEELAETFAVSLGWAKKISAQRNRTGQSERVPHKPGRKPQVSAQVEEQVALWVRDRPDLTLAELSSKLSSEASVVLSRGRVWYLLRKLDLRLKKSRSMPANAIQKPTAHGAKNSSNVSVRPRRSI